MVVNSLLFPAHNSTIDRCRRRSGSLRNFKARVTVRGHISALFAIWRQSEVRHEDSGFSGNICAEIPRITGWKQRAIGDRVDLGNPIKLCCWQHLNGIEGMRSQMLHALGDPTDVVFDCTDHIGQYRRVSRAYDREQVGKSGGSNAQVINRAIRPLIAKKGPTLPRMSMFNKAPVMASKPVAKTMLSRS